MRKEIIATPAVSAEKHGAAWLDLATLARVRITSEDPEFPIENALTTTLPRNEAGWRAASPGPQTITLLFDAPQRVRRISLHFVEQNEERSQEFVLRYSSATETDREIVRQQWSFSPNGSAQESEDYTVDLSGVTRLELVIDPDRGRLRSPATLYALRLA